ncbi:hypothetical protein K6119_09485 [Paracrocinitomix mangrovi]|uniref:hypothetical protein n=1 Tax=Paracrocinitomix mangrovi TaxID=2862509 RepID=UPI001C8D7E82|nr:hypothetical protein [Paracrocinitomix mangrovi]UKN03722.1 hypothetical protein K6119_09485 [Paracrocinitomix mangrovi]
MLISIVACNNEQENDEQYSIEENNPTELGELENYIEPMVDTLAHPTDTFSGTIPPAVDN